MKISWDRSLLCPTKVSVSELLIRISVEAGKLVNHMFKIFIYLHWEVCFKPRTCFILLPAWYLRVTVCYESVFFEAFPWWDVSAVRRFHTTGEEGQVLEIYQGCIFFPISLTVLARKFYSTLFLLLVCKLDLLLSYRRISL